jgi:hypothetical protein
VFALGLFAWNVPLRYTSMALPPMLLCAFAVAQRATDWLLVHMHRMQRLAKRETLGAAFTAVCVINPASTAAVVDGGYGLHPDHKGAAEFMRAQQIVEDDVVLAEDVLQQTYYLGEVDYWLIGREVARRYVKQTKAGVVDFYTGTPVITSGEELQEVLQRDQGQRIFIIGSGENQADQRRRMRGDEIFDMVESDRFTVVYKGRDGLTKVWMARPPSH